MGSGSRISLVVVCGCLAGASAAFGQNTPPPEPARNLPPDEAFRLTLSVEEIRQANSEVREQNRQDEMRRQWEEAQRLKKAAALHAPKSEALPTLSLKDWADENQRQLNALSRRNVLIGDTVTDGAKKDEDRKQTRKLAAPPSDATAAAPRDTTLRDYTSATTKALQESGPTNSVLKSLSPTLTLSNRNFSIWNRPPAKIDTKENTASRALPGSAQGGAGEFNRAARSSAKGAGSSLSTPALSSPNFVPSSPLEATKSPNATPGPLEVVQSSFASPQFQHLPNPYPTWASPNTANPTPEPAAPSPKGNGAAAGRDPTAQANAGPGDAEAVTAASLLERPSVFAPSPLLSVPTLSSLGLNPVQPGQQQGTPTAKTGQAASGPGQPVSGVNTKPSASYPGLTPLNSSQPFGLQPFQPVNPLNPYSPGIPRPSGPNANGFYEPKSITDLQFGR